MASGGPFEPPGSHSPLGELTPYVANVGANPTGKRHRRKHNHPVSDRDSTAANVITYASLLSQGRLRLSHSPDELQSFIEAHVERTRNKYSPDAIEQAAEADAAGFEWPAAAMHQDAEEVLAKGSLRGAIEAKIESQRSTRFNAERFDALFSADPEYDTLRDIAAHGARIEVPPEVILDREPPPFREKQLRMPLTCRSTRASYGKREGASFCVQRTYLWKNGRPSLTIRHTGHQSPTMIHARLPQAAGCWTVQQ